MNSLNPTLFIESQQPDIAFRVREVPVYGRLVLAPMDGLSDRPFRSLTRRLGSAMSYSEFINTVDILYGTPHIEKKLSFYPYEHPIVIQIFDDDPERMLRGALKVRQRNPDILDVNLGCSAKTVTHRGAGAALLKTPEKIAQIISSLVKHLDIPVTAKIRLGWDDASRNYLEIAKIIEENGGALIAVHARTRNQGYTGPVDWDAIAEIKQAVRIPVIGNGDVKSVADIQQIKTQTGCDGVMIGRAAIGNPWIFSRMDRQDVPPQLERATIRQHLNANLNFYGPQRGLTLFRKHLKRYLAPYAVSNHTMGAMLTSTDPVEVWGLIESVLLSSEAVKP